MSLRFRSRKHRFSVLLIRPTKYDDEGYVIRYIRGVLPSNTLGVLHALTRQAFAAAPFGDNPELVTETRLLDDTIDNINVGKLARQYLRNGARAVVAFAAVQTNQFPRASDLARRFKAAGFEVMVGGFHVSGAIAMSRETPPECQALIDAGVTLVKGEVEAVWGDLLEDAWRGRLRPFYEINERPDISNAPVPVIDWRYQKRFAYRYMGTIDASRGCPYGCTFCTVINVQGHKMRCRSAASIARQVEANYRAHKIDYYFFTDDNFSRNTEWEAVFDALIALREDKDISIQFMMQIDTKAWLKPRFVEKASLAGCTQAFIGIESLNEKNLAEVAKTQNNVDDLGEMMDVWHAAGIGCHAGYIVGFPYDTPRAVAQDVKRLKELGLDQCSFFMLTPLPGSEDHATLVRDGVWMDPDLNNYDSYHETLHLPGFSEGEWLTSCVDAWESFYSFKNMRAALQRCNARTYWGMFKNFMWYRSALLEGVHPMVSGLWRMKSRTDRRPGCRVEGRLSYWWRRLRDGWETMRGWVPLFFELQELWLQTRFRSDAENAAMEYARTLREKWDDGVTRLGERATEARQSLEQGKENARDWAQESASEMRESVERRREEAVEWMNESAAEFRDRVREGLDTVQDTKARQRDLLEARWARMLVRWNSRGKRPQIVTRRDLNKYWRRLGGWARRGRVVRLSFETPRIGINLLRDVRLSATFFVYFLHELTCD